MQGLTRCSTSRCGTPAGEQVQKLYLAPFDPVYHWYLMPLSQVQLTRNHGYHNRHIRAKYLRTFALNSPPMADKIFELQMKIMVAQVKDPHVRNTSHPAA